MPQNSSSDDWRAQSDTNAELGKLEKMLWGGALWWGVVGAWLGGTTLCPLNGVEGEGSDPYSRGQ